MAVLPNKTINGAPVSFIDMAHTTQLSILPGYNVAIFSKQLLSKKYLMAYELSIQWVSKWGPCFQREKFEMASSLQIVQIVGFYLELSNPLNR